MIRAIAICVLALWIDLSLAQAPTATPTATGTVVETTVTTVKPETKFDATAATQEFMNRLQGEARAKSDAYAEGGYWLLLWTLLYGLVVAWLLLSSGVSSRIRDFAER
ncbi:MAG: hypothetical protein JNN20_03020, partial [Betaproteobacteria bacterium]|nr:hypothetical protein [Betaproteobacteria bacterium]